MSLDFDHGLGSTLDTIAAGTIVRVVSVGGGCRTIRRLTALGVVPGALVTVTRPRGPALLRLNGASVAVDRSVARGVRVRRVEP